MAGLLPKWVEDYIVHPFAYGGDQAANDLVGERGILGVIPDTLGMDRWETTIPKPDGFWKEMISEVPRTIIESGGMVLSPRMLPAMVGGGISGFVRDPGELSSEEDMTARKNQLALGAIGAGVGNLFGNLGAKALEKLWLNAFAPSAKAAVQEYGATGTQFAGAKYWHSNPQQFEQKLGHLPTAEGTFRRGVRPDHPTEISAINGLKEGDIYEPGRALSSDRYGLDSEASAEGLVNELDEVGKAATKPGPYIYIKTKNAREMTGVLGWEEVATLPSSKFKVTRVVRDDEGNVVELYLEDLSSPSMLRQTNDVLKETGRETVSVAPRSLLETAKLKRKKQNGTQTAPKR